MQKLIPEQRYDLYGREAQQTGVHGAILAALCEVHQQPVLTDGETGLGVSPANQIPLAAVNSFAGQVLYAAKTLRSLENSLIAQGWKGKDFWQQRQGGYSDRFLTAIAQGYLANPSTSPSAARLERCNPEKLQQAYRQHLLAEVPPNGELHSQTDHNQTHYNQAYIDDALRSLLAQLPSQYLGLTYQREALLALVQAWQGLPNRDTVLSLLSLDQPSGTITDSFSLDTALLRFLTQALSTYAAYPHQREAFLHLVQRWQQFDSRFTTLLALQQGISFFASDAIDSALLAFIQTVPRRYQASGEQRNALVEGFRLWQQLESRPAALIALGVNPDLFAGNLPQPDEIANAGVQADRALLDFIHHIPAIYTGSGYQRDALIHLVQLWYNAATSEQALQIVLDDLKQIEAARKNSDLILPPPQPLHFLPPPQQWSPATLQLHAPILATGSFTWADATRGGLYLPPSQIIVDTIAQMAERVEQIRDRLGHSLTVIRWYCPPDADSTLQSILNHRHPLGDAIAFYCDGLTGNQIYWALDPWWQGGLARYSVYPYLCYIDSRRDRVRWG